MDSHHILDIEESLDVERAFRAELDAITNDDRPGYYYDERQETFEALASESPTGYLCSSCQGHATHYSPSPFHMLSQTAPDYRYPWCLNCRDLVLLTAHEALVRMGSTQDYDTFAQKYLCEKAVETMLAGPLTKRALDTFHDDGNRHQLVQMIGPRFECDIAGCTRMQAISVCPQHAQERHQKAVAKHQREAVRADRTALLATTTALLATIILPLWLIPDEFYASITTSFATGMALLITSNMWMDANQKHRKTPHPGNSL